METRLDTLLALVPKCRVLADIGADHGKLGLRLLKRNICSFVYFTDISAPSLTKARRLASDEGIEDKCAFRVGDGFDALDADVDAAVIAGMGGALIASIVERGRARAGNATLVLQPNVALCEMRRRVTAAGYRITGESLSREGGRWYAAVRVEPGTMRLSEAEAFAGPILLSRRDENLSGYAAFRLRVLGKALAGARKAGAPEAEELARAVSVWNEIASGL